MFVHNKGRKIIDDQNIEDKECPVCEKKRSFRFRLVYEYEGIWGFCYIRNFKVYYMCSTCERGIELDEDKAIGIYTRMPIPFLDRYGMLAMIAGFAIFGLIGFLAEVLNSAKLPPGSPIY
jgi:hypothetical protein